MALFWAAFVLTEPLGATVGDLLTRGHEVGGLGLCTLGSSAVLGGVLLALVVHATWKNRQPPIAAAAA